MRQTIPLAVLRKGFLRLNLFGLPVSLMLLLFLGTMAGGSPGAPGAVKSFGLAAAIIYLFPAALVLAHVVGAKLFDAVLRLVPLGKPEVSILGILLTAILIVIAGNVFLDDLYQVRQGNYGLSVGALLLDLGGMAAVILVGGGRLRG
jgi:hypothetical protein